MRRTELYWSAAIDMIELRVSPLLPPPCLCWRENRRKQQCSHVANFSKTTQVTHVVEVQTLLIPAWEQMLCRKVFTVVSLLCEMSMHLCWNCFLAACFISEFPHLHSVSWVLHQLFPSLCLLDEPSVQKSETAINKVLLFVLTLSLLEICRFCVCTSRAAQFFLIY